MNDLQMIGRSKSLFDDDLFNLEEVLKQKIRESSFLVIGGAGTIGQAVTEEIFKRAPQKLHVVDISENNLVELVRTLRSSRGYIQGDFETFAIDCASSEFDALTQSCGPYDYVLNLSALKHVRSEKDPYTLMRLVQVNILNTLSTLELARSTEASKYFCVSTDKAANPVNMMGASKRIMELFLMKESERQNLSTARFANVAFSDGSLLHGFNQRLLKKQPITAPNDVRRYFVTKEESGILCLLSTIFGNNREIYFPKLSESLNLVSFADIAKRFLAYHGYEVHECQDEEEARTNVDSLLSKKKWPCYFFKSDTTGEKDFEEFFTETETLDLEKYQSIGIIKNQLEYSGGELKTFLSEISELKNNLSWSKEDLVMCFNRLLPDFDHMETGRYLEGKM